MLKKKTKKKVSLKKKEKEKNINEKYSCWENLRQKKTV